MKKLNMKNELIKWAFAVTCAAFTTVGANAATIDLATDGVGVFTPTVIPPPTMTDAFLNNMITVYNSHTSPTTIGAETYTIEKGSATPDPLSASLSLSVNNSVLNSPLSFTFTLPAGTKYLIAQWDGPQGLDAVYYVGNLSGSVTINNDVPGSNSQGQPYANFGLSDLWFGDSTPSVPDGGSTVLLLGAALSGLGLIRRKLS